MRLARLNPFRALPNPREVWAWSMFDLANQSFTLIINTLLFGVFLSAVVLGEGPEAKPGDGGPGDLTWSIFGSVSLGVVVLLSPVLGAIADARALKKAFLVGSGVCCAAMTCSLALIPSGEQAGVVLAVAIAAALYVPANIAFNLSENFLGSFLPEIATRETVGRVSAIGWTSGYVGALCLLVLVAVMSKVFGLGGPHDHRPIFVFAGLWFAVMLLPTVLFLRERAEPEPKAARRGAVRAAFARLAGSARDVAGFRDLAVLLTAFFVYGMGVQVIIFFGGKIVRDDFGMPVEGQALFLVTITVSAALSAVVCGRFQDRVGHARTIFTLLAVWAVTAIGLGVLVHLRAGAPDPGAFPTWPVWLAGFGVGVGLGGIGTATRAAVGDLTPAHQAAEFFGLWGATYKLAGVVGLPIFGAVRSALGSTWSFGILTVFFAIGAAILAFADFGRGRRAAQASEKAHADEIEPDDLVAR